jgi:hypothetical protein
MRQTLIEERHVLRSWLKAKGLPADVKRRDANIPVAKIEMALKA